MGIAVVVPARQIKEVLYLPEQVEMRKRIEEERMKEDESSSTDTEFSLPKKASKKARRKIAPKKK